MNIALWLSKAARQYRDRPALFWEKEQYGTYENLNNEAGKISTWLIGLGIMPGDRIAIFMLNHPDYLRLLFGIWYSGAVAVPINAKLHAKEAIWITENAEVKLILASGQQSNNLQKETRPYGKSPQLIDLSSGALLAAIKNLHSRPVLQRVESDLAWLFYTSGTTGRPKGVMITHGMLKSMTLNYFADVDEVRKEDAAIYSAPFSHGAGLYSIMHVLRGARHVFPQSGGFKPEEILCLSEYFQILK